MSAAAARGRGALKDQSPQMSAPPSVEAPARAASYTGIFPCQKIREMVRDREISTTDILAQIEPDQIQPASIDLRLGEFAYPVDASFLPGRGVRVLDKMRQLDARYEDFKIDLRNGAVLEKGGLYVIPLLESIRLKSEVAAFANPKSSTGRLDILTRLIADEATVFDQVEEGYSRRALPRGRPAQLQCRRQDRHAPEPAALAPHARRERQAHHRGGMAHAARQRPDRRRPRHRRAHRRAAVHH